MRIDHHIRQWIPSLVPLTRRPLLARALDLADRAIGWPIPEFRSLPPNRMRVRVGVGNRVLANQANYLETGAHMWMRLFGLGLARPDSDVLDVGSGCGRMARPLRSEMVFTGTYVGVDVDREMVAWCQQHLADERFSFVRADAYNRLYNPTG